MYNILDLNHQAETLCISHEEKHELADPVYVKKPNYYDILNIKPDASQEQIKKMFKRLSLAYHPDTEADTGVNGDHRFRTIIKAYETLKKPDKRKKYDLEIGIQQ
jgi:DnaJ-class molecular chaperone